MGQLKTFSKWTITSVAVLGIFVACGKKDDGGGSNTVAPLPVVSCYQGQVPPTGYSCSYNSGGYANGNLLNNLQFDDGLSFTGRLSLTATSANIDLNHPSAYAMYNGPVAISGQLTVTNGGALCGAPNGTYNFNGQATYMGGTISGLDLTVNGPAAIRFVGAAVIYNPNGVSRDSATNRLTLQVNASVNGGSCGYIMTY
ncbi:MAG: hypothetical protein COT73_10470 [Bdellovibrio sp. CG10_big_fil_rev_8_21_14_0_10_47_8]|nr:MAG: hypothetical protein COT73_10470 [Bdellovibrio sp. CG10_big_fil_rev_8_21_14_0_10_47_8]